MDRKIMNVLFLCTGNSARSIVGEVLFNSLFSKHGNAVSAGSKPTGKPNPLALKILSAYGHDINNLSSKHVEHFFDREIDLVISVCSNAEKECVIWQGKGNPQRLHWPLPDPETEEQFEAVYTALKEKLKTHLQAQ